MEVKNRKILEALQMQPLSEEEMTARHILGRLYGPIASCVESTRNTRLYNRELWEKALKDEIFLEKVATKALFLELGHPADREETDMKQTCACIPEVPKIVGDDLCAYVDILDTPNGRLLKTLVDYGFVPGISSRGSGDVMENNQVDPETFFLETWDIVQLPAVKKARLNVCESLNSNGIKLKKALAESYKAAKEEDKDTMKKALKNLNIDIEEEISEQEPVTEETSAKVLTADDIPWSEDEDMTLTEDTEDETPEETTESEETSTEDVEETEETSSEEVEETADEEEAADVADSTEEQEENVPEDGVVDVTSEGEVDVNTIGDIVELLQEFDDDTDVEFELTQPNGEVSPVENVEHYFDDDTLVLNVKACEDTDEKSDDADSNKELETEDEETSVEAIEEIDEEPESADNDGDAEVIESLKEMIRQK